jgi:hypothetical protein
MRGLYLDQDGYLTVDIFNPFGMNDETVIIGDEEHTEAVSIYLSSSDEDGEIL